MARYKTDDNIIWNINNEKGIQINIIPIKTNTNIPSIALNEVSIKYHMVSQQNNGMGRLIGTCLPNILQVKINNLYHIKTECIKLINWVHSDYFLAGSSYDPLTNMNAKYELYYWPFFTKYPSLVLNIPATTKSNGEIILFLDPKCCWVNNLYISDHIHKLCEQTKGNTTVLIIGYVDMIQELNSCLGSRRFQRRIIPIPK